MLHPLRDFPFAQQLLVAAEVWAHLRIENLDQSVQSPGLLLSGDDKAKARTTK